MKLISEFFHKRAKTTNIILLLVILVMFFAVTLPILNIFAKEYMNLPSLDHADIYSPSEIFNIVESWSEKGRTWQIIFHLTWDLILPVLSIMLFGVTISFMTQRCFSENSKIQNLNLVALIYSFDFLENIAIEFLAISYPVNIKIVAILKNIFTISKYLSGIIIILIIVILLIILLIKKQSKNRKI